MDPLITHLPLYQCHKQVRAARITAINGGTLEFGEIGMGTGVSGEWMERHKPEVGGFYVVYDDGYISYSPAKAFEGGYTRIDGPAAEHTDASA